MNELSKLLQENLNIEFISATLSNPKKKDDVQKVKVRPVLKKEVLYFQLCAQLRVCSQAGGIPVYPRFSQPDNSESWNDVGNGI